MSDSYLSWINLALIILIIVFLIIIAILFFNYQGVVEIFGVPYTIQPGTLTESSDIMVLTGNQIYIAQSSVPLTLTLNRGSNQGAGRTAGIKNNTGNNLTLLAGTIKFSVGQINNTVNVGETAWLLSTDNTDSWLRLT
jgi:hypothetical protein